MRYRQVSRECLCVTSEFRDRDLGWGFRSKPRTPLKCYFIFLAYADILPTNFPFIRKHLSTDLTKGSFGHFSSFCVIKISKMSKFFKILHVLTIESNCF